MSEEEEETEDPDVLEERLKKEGVQVCVCYVCDCLKMRLMCWRHS